jgi:thermostable 8-oxoguanine DNA glycosylase
MISKAECEGIADAVVDYVGEEIAKAIKQLEVRFHHAVERRIAQLEEKLGLVPKDVEAESQTTETPAEQGGA